MRKRVAAIIHRWGADIVGGETLAREVLSGLSESLDITVLTSCARDYVSWSNFYPPGTTTDGRIRLVRFPVKMQRPVRAFNLLSRLVLQRRLPFVKAPLWVERVWIRWQGPYCPDLIAYLKRHRGDFEAFLFYTYLYYPVARGLPEVADKGILIPTAHDERPIYLETFRRLFRLPRALIYLTAEEQAFANRLFGTYERPQRVASMRIRTIDDRDEAIPPSGVREFLRAHHIDQPYLLYLGRIDPAKGVDTMFRFFLRYVREGKRGELLVLAGDQQAEIPESASIRYLGFLSEQEKRTAIMGSRALVLLSPYESFSISVLEALGLGRPVIVTSESAVLKGHVERSRAGFVVSTYDEFRAAADQVLAAADNDLGRMGIQYVKENYNWERVEKAYLELIDEVRRKT